MTRLPRFPALLDLATPFLKPTPGTAPNGRVARSPRRPLPWTDVVVLVRQVVFGEILANRSRPVARLPARRGFIPALAGGLVDLELSLVSRVLLVEKILVGFDELR